MNHQLIKAYIEQYKKEFHRIHKQEIYKWKAIKQFQDNFNIDAKDFHENLDLALLNAKNLLDSGQYFPKRMLLQNAKVSPEKIREMFRILYDEDFDLVERMKSFSEDFEALNTKNYRNKKSYQDARAIIVYLALRYPERYFFYKFRMFKDFLEKIGYPFQPVMGSLKNNTQYQTMCNLIRHEIEEDQELLKLHQTRIDDDCYHDVNHYILTQDFIYAVVRHLDKQEPIPIPKKKTPKIKEVSTTDLILKSEEPDFTPITVNYIQNSIENKRIGDLGELWVLEYEREHLIKNGKNKLAAKVKHAAKDKGDGLGYDILSYSIDGKEKLIEVKTTKDRFNSTFYVTRNELEKSKLADNYFVYRVYNFDDKQNTGKLIKIKGDLTSICNVPVNYKVNLKKLKKSN